MCYFLLDKVEQVARDGTILWNFIVLILLLNFFISTPCISLAYFFLIFNTPLKHEFLHESAYRNSYITLRLMYDNYIYFFLSPPTSQIRSQQTRQIHIGRHTNKKQCGRRCKFFENIRESKNFHLMKHKKNFYTNICWWD